MYTSKWALDKFYIFVYTTKFVKLFLAKSPCSKTLVPVFEQEQVHRKCAQTLHDQVKLVKTLVKESDLLVEPTRLTLEDICI